MCTVQCEKNLAEKWKLNLLTDWLTSFKICNRFYFANSVLVELKALNIIKSLVISSTRNETRLNLGWVFLPGFLGVFTQKILRFWGVSTRVSECWPLSLLKNLSIFIYYRLYSVPIPSIHVISISLQYLFPISTTTLPTTQFKLILYTTKSKCNLSTCLPKICTMSLQQQKECNDWMND